MSRTNAFSPRHHHRGMAPILVTLLALSSIPPAMALDISSNSISASLDTTLSLGKTARLGKRDPAIVGIANGGTAYGVNADDGNLNYHRGFISKTAKITSEIELDYRNFSAFVRGSAFYDYLNMESTPKKAPLSDEAEALVGSDAEILDAYVAANFTAANRPLDIRVGSQVLSWGESTFIQNSINTINPVDVSKLRVPGAELREALKPVPLVSASVGATENSSFELFYQLQWQETIIDPPGSYFSTEDFAGPGGERVLLGFGAVPDTIAANSVVSPPANTAVVSRGATRTPDDSGQLGLAYRLFLPALNDSELGFYYMNYHSRVPLIGATTGTAAAAAGLDPSGLSYVQTARYFTSYPEDIKLYGLSFNTQINRTGTALQGEVSLRQDVPLQIDDVEILFAALGAQDNLSPGLTSAAPLAQYGQLGLIPFETDIMGYIRRDVSQAQITATQVFGPTLGADSAALVGEIGYTHVFNMPNKDDLRLNGPGTFLSGNAALAQPAYAALHPSIYESADKFADEDSWGYRLAGRLDFNNVIAGINVSPRFAWQHDIEGISPGPGGNFLAGRRALTLGATAVYQNSWSIDFSYTRYSGAGRYNLINDRDFIAGDIKYSF